MALKVKMVPGIARGESGITRVLEAYFKYLPDYGIELVSQDSGTYDLVAAHAGILAGDCDVAHLHGLYWTADYNASNDEYETNKNVIASALAAKLVTVPSRWVAKALQRDMRINPEVLPHGIEADLWTHNNKPQGYVLWNKNRNSDVCDPNPIGGLAAIAPDVLFASTFAPKKQTPNLKVIGVQSHADMKTIVQYAGVYLSTTKETFGIGTLEAMASGTPVLGWANGGNLDLVEHGVTGYLAQPGNYEDLLQGLRWCLKYRDDLSANCAEAAKQWSWSRVIHRLSELYTKVYMAKDEPTAAIIIPVYNKSIAELGRAVDSAIRQTYDKLIDVIIVDDCSTNGIESQVFTELDSRICILKTPKNSGVANARNLGIANTSAKYITCLDADDAIEPKFIETCVTYLEQHKDVGIAYTKLSIVHPDGTVIASAWPHGNYDYKRVMEKYTQVPTCNVFRRSVWEKLGGYRQRYAPYGAGEEDGEFWLRIGSIGYKAELVTEEPLFLYHTGSNTVGGNPSHVATDWTAWHPWVNDGKHPFASIAKPVNRSHPVRQYDEPTVSVIIPVAPWHTGFLVDALDSLEAQTVRNWEAVCVFDGMPQNLTLYERVKKAYPYIEVIENFGPSKGSGWARDAGVKKSKGKLITFLDADDYLAPQFLELTLKAYLQVRGIIYTDYTDRAIWNKEAYDKLPSERKLHYNDKTGEAFIRRYAKEYDYDQAIRQPEYDPHDVNSPFYVWCITNVLMPRSYYDEVGGLDQKLDTWEDVDLLWRMARAGMPFHRVPEPLVTYRFTSGSRREHGMVRDEKTKKAFQDRIQYLKDKYKELPIMPCSGCGGGSNGGSTLASQTFNQLFAAKASKGGFETVNDNDMVEAEYIWPNRGMHPVVGPATGKQYGYHKQGDRFLVHVNDMAARPEAFQKIIVTKVEVEEEVKTPEPPAPPPTPERVEPEIVDEPVADFSNVSGVTKQTESKLIAADIYNAADIVAAGKEGLEKAGVPSRTATLILNSATKQV